MWSWDINSKAWMRILLWSTELHQLPLQSPFSPKKVSKIFHLIGNSFPNGGFIFGTINSILLVFKLIFLHMNPPTYGLTHDNIFTNIIYVFYHSNFLTSEFVQQCTISGVRTLTIKQEVTTTLQKSTKLLTIWNKKAQIPGNGRLQSGA